MIFLRDDGYYRPHQIRNVAPSAAPNAEFLFDTNERPRQSDIAVTHSKQTTELPFDTNEACRTFDIAVTRSKPTIGPLSIRYIWNLHRTLPLSEKIAKSAVQAPRA
jgi:hypothetical protein